jgi:hypothetical protein
MTTQVIAAFVGTLMITSVASARVDTPYASSASTAHFDQAKLITAEKAVDRQFAAHIYANLRSAPDLDKRLANLTDKDLAGLAYMLQRYSALYSDGAEYTPRLLQLIKDRTTAETQARVSKAFAPLRAVDHSLTLRAAVATPNIDMTAYEVYLDYLTSGLTGTSALAMTAEYIGAQFSAAALAGYTIGEIINDLATVINPNWPVATTDFMEAIMDAMPAAIADYEDVGQ